MVVTGSDARIIKDDKNALHNLLPSKLNRPLRRRGHDFELPIVKTERFKNAFILLSWNVVFIIVFYLYSYICELRFLYY